MAELSDADVLRILELIDRSSFDYFQLTLGDLRLTVSKAGLPAEAVDGGGVGRASVPERRPAEPMPSGPATVGEGAGGPESAAAPPAGARPPGDGIPAGLVPVRAPMVGTFYVAPAPDAPPFVEVGSLVEKDTTVGLVEAMKVFTSVLAGVRGVIARRVAENAEFVEYGQTLFLVRPEDT